MLWWDRHGECPGPGTEDAFNFMETFDEPKLVEGYHHWLEHHFVNLLSISIYAYVQSKQNEN